MAVLAYKLLKGTGRRVGEVGPLRQPVPQRAGIRPGEWAEMAVSQHITLHGMTERRPADTEFGVEQRRLALRLAHIPGVLQGEHTVDPRRLAGRQRLRQSNTFQQARGQPGNCERGVVASGQPGSDGLC